MSDKLAAVLDEIEEFLENQADAHAGLPLPNRAMNLLAELQNARSTPAPSVAPEDAPVSATDYRDAARYRWLRVNSTQPAEEWSTHSNPESLDAAIDAAMQRSDDDFSELDVDPETHPSYSADPRQKP